MGLEDDVNSAEAALPSGGQGRADLGGVMAIVVDNADVSDFALELEAAIDAAEILERAANGVDRDVEADASGDGSGGVQDIVRAGDMNGYFNTATRRAQCFSDGELVESADSFGSGARCCGGVRRLHGGAGLAGELFPALEDPGYRDPCEQKAVAPASWPAVARHPALAAADGTPAGLPPRRRR